MSQPTTQESTFATTRTSGPERELEMLLTGAGVISLSETGWIKVTGSDRVRWLNGMVTNSVQDLAEGEGCYSFMLNAQGRIQGDGYIFAQRDHLLVQTGLNHVPGMMTALDRFIIMDDVELTDISGSVHGLLVAGPRAGSLLRELEIPAPASSRSESPQSGLQQPGVAQVPWRSAELMIVRAYSPLTPRFEIWADEASIVELSAEIVERGASRFSAAALELLRMLEGTPLYGVDIRDRDLPQETGAVRALHFSKGCYLGQEIVERIRSRGNVHRTLQGFYLQGSPAAAGLALSSEGKPVGELTSVASIAASTGSGSAQIGLGYIRREALAQSKPIQYEGGVAQPAALPFDTAKIL